MIEGHQANMKGPTYVIHERTITNVNPTQGTQRFHQQTGWTRTFGTQHKFVKEKLGQVRQLFNDLTKQLDPVNRQYTNSGSMHRYVDSKQEIQGDAPFGRAPIARAAPDLRRCRTVLGTGAVSAACNACGKMPERRILVFLYVEPGIHIPSSLVMRLRPVVALPLRTFAAFLRQ